ncbi:MAG: DUF1580 domain-containing protein [Planctomycetaceae bacterium]|nr:DUF1580 domain-containing protein [Planctomycetaceae bacterium]
MIDPLTETPISLAEADGLVPRRRGGKRCNVATVYRWTVKGVRGIKLESYQCGGSRCTSREALSRFFARLTQAADPQSPPVTVPQYREKQIATAERAMNERPVPTSVR